MDDAAKVNDSQGPGERLVPLPRRRLDEGDPEQAQILTSSPTAVVTDLLERTDHLLDQLEQDIASLKRDQAKDRQRIEREAEDRQSAAEAAIERLQILARKAHEIAVRKARTDVLDQALARSATLDPDMSFDQLVGRIEEEIRLAKGITGAIRLATIGDLLKQATLRVEYMTKQAERARDHFLKGTEKELHSEGKEARASYEIGMSYVRRDLKALDVALPPSGLAFDDKRWQHWEGWDPLSGVSRWIRFGSFYRPLLERFRFPALLELPGGRGLAIDVNTGDRTEAIDGLRSMLVRILASIPAGDVCFTFIDPVGLGDSVAALLPLGEYQGDLIDGGVAAREEQIEEKLSGLSDHIERVIQEHLRGEFDTIDVANEAAGEIVEPYRVVAVFDFPNALTERAEKLLKKIVASGPRCGVYTIMTTAPGAARAIRSKWGAKLAGLAVITGTPDGYVVDRGAAGEWRVAFDAPPELLVLDDDGERTLFGRILTTTGEAAKAGRSAVLSPTRTFDLLAEALRVPVRDDLPVVASLVVADDPSTWWVGDSTSGLSAPIGRTGPHEVTCLAFDSVTRPGVVVGGEPGSGRSMLLHDTILSLAMIYPPDELALYLVDFANRSTAPFESYAIEGLPHARVVAIESEREFGVSVLDGLVREMTRRAMLLAPHGGERAGIEGYRRQSGDALARIVLVIDGIEQLFAADDRISDHAAQLLDTLSRQGPAHGIHMLVATDAMGALERLGHHTCDHLRVRVALACAEDESKRILGDADGSANMLERAGEGVLAFLDGDPSEARRFQATFLDPHERDLALRDLRRLADERGYARRPQVFEGNAPARLEDSAILGLARRADQQTLRRQPRLQPRLWLGEPVVLGGPVETTLRREAGSNLLVVGRDQRLGQGLLMAALTSAALGHGRDLDVRVLDFAPIESGLSEGVSALAEQVPVRVFRRRQVGEALQGVRAEIERRVEAREFRSHPILFVVDGLGAAPEFDVADPGTSANVTVLEDIVRNGPELGVHTLMWADSPVSLANRLSRATVQAFALRVVLQLPAEDSALLIDSGAAATLKENQALLYDEHATRLTKLRPYPLPSLAFVGQLSSELDAALTIAAPHSTPPPSAREKPGTTAASPGVRSTVSA